MRGISGGSCIWTGVCSTIRPISDEKKPVEGHAEVRAKLQGVLDQMAKVKAPAFNKYEAFGKAY